MIIREATGDDVSSINDLLNWHSENGFATFGEAKTVEQRLQWFQQFGSPEKQILVAQNQDQIIGLTCSFAYRGGGVFSQTLETSLYTHHSWNGKGIGSLLYQELFQRLQKTQTHRVLVGIALPNEASVAIHKKFGFEEIGIFDEYAFYKGQYRSSLWMQKKMIPNSKGSLC
ncbi:MAG: N-acetyltransferase family protein [Pseudomonadota bacterium]